MRNRLIGFMHDTGIYDRVIAGLGKLVDEDKIQCIIIIMDEWRITVNNKSTTRHGCCKYNKKEIELHFLLLKEGNEADRDQTFVHEIAHVIAPLIYGNHIRGHGREWKNVMRCFGARPDRTSSHESMNEFKMQKARIIYACNKCEQEFPAQRRKKYPPEQYTHKGCGGTMYLKHNRVTGYRSTQTTKEVTAF